MVRVYDIYIINREIFKNKWSFTIMFIYVTKIEKQKYYFIIIKCKWAGPRDILLKKYHMLQETLFRCEGWWHKESEEGFV